MINAIKNKINQYTFELNKSIQDLSVLVSFSAGIDSTVLSYLMIELRAKYGFSLYLIHFNHNAHKKAKHMEQFCRSFARLNDVKYFSKQFSFQKSCNFESSSRKKRYSELNNKANLLKCDIILTAHHKDDQIETLYMKKIDGADWISKIGIRESLGRIKRPLLEINKAAIRETAKDRSLSWIEDPTNNNVSFRRNYVRNILLPEALKKSPVLIDNLMAEAETCKSRLVSLISNFDNSKKILIRNESKNHISINLTEIIKLEIEELKIFLYWCIRDKHLKYIPKYSRKFWDQFSKYLTSSRSGCKFLIGNIICFIQREKMFLIITSSDVLNRPSLTKISTNNIWYGSTFDIKNTNHFIHSSNKTKIVINNVIFQNGLYTRRWKRGDKIYSATSNSHVLVSDLFINNKLSSFDKLVRPIVVDKQDKIVWIPGIAHSKLAEHYDTNKMKRLEWKLA